VDRVPSQDLLDVIDAAQLRQAWFRDYALANEMGPSRVSPIGAKAEVVEAASSITTDLAFSVADRARLDRDEIRNHLRHAFESLGGIAIFTGIVGNDTHRVLDRSEFRGFTLADPIAPLIFVNSASDSLAGQTFTFLHEYAHVARGQSGIGDEDPAGLADHDDGIERWCDSVAAEVIVPVADLQREYRADESIASELDRLAGRYRASTVTVLLQLRQARLVPRQGFDEVYSAEFDRVMDRVALRTARSGGNFYANQPFHLGESFSRAVINETLRGTVTYSDAFRLLGLRSTEQIDKYAKSLGML
jgi:Zn-dependent peptidase ImmA (M78 family)